MQHDEHMADPSYVQALERHALACEEENDRLRAEIAAVSTLSPLLTTLLAHTLIHTNAEIRRSKPS